MKSSVRQIHNEGPNIWRVRSRNPEKRVTSAQEKGKTWEKWCIYLVNCNNVTEEL